MRLAAGILLTIGLVLPRPGIGSAAPRFCGCDSSHQLQLCRRYEDLATVARVPNYGVSFVLYSNHAPALSCMSDQQLINCLDAGARYWQYEGIPPIYADQYSKTLRPWIVAFHLEGGNYLPRNVSPPDDVTDAVSKITVACGEDFGGPFAEVTDAVIVLNFKNFCPRGTCQNCADAPTTACIGTRTVVDVAPLFAHEVGHVLGFYHPEANNDCDEIMDTGADGAFGGCPDGDICNQVPCLFGASDLDKEAVSLAYNNGKPSSPCTITIVSHGGSALVAVKVVASLPRGTTADVVRCRGDGPEVVIGQFDAAAKPGETMSWVDPAAGRAPVYRVVVQDRYGTKWAATEAWGVKAGRVARQ